MNNNKPTHDFSVLDQEKWIISASLGKKLMKDWAEGLVKTSPTHIVQSLIHELEAVRESSVESKKVENAISVAIAFANERQLIGSIISDNWDAYKLPEETPK